MSLDTGFWRERFRTPSAWPAMALPRWSRMSTRPPGEDGEPSGEESHDPPSIDVPPSEEGRSGKLGPPPPGLLRDLTGGGSDNPPPPYEVTQARDGDGGRRWWPRILAGFVALLVLFTIANIIVGLYIDRLWFDELGYRGVFNTRIGTQVWLFFAAFGVAFVFILGNILLAWKLPLGSRTAPLSPFQEVPLETVRRGALWIGAIGALLLSIIFGVVAVGQWEEILQFIHAEDFGISDDQFNQDVGFYVFQLEPLQFIKGWATGVAILALLASIVVYGFRFIIHSGDIDTTRRVRIHVVVLLVTIIGLFIWGYWLARFELTVTDNGVVFGATYTDVNARLVALWILMVVGAIAAVSLLSWPFHQRLRFPGGAMALLFVASIIGTVIYPAIIQRFTVEPNELAREAEFIERNITATRFAFGLDDVLEQEFPAEPVASIEDIEANPEVLKNVRLWDHRPLRDTLNNIQTQRSQYIFPDVDVDRYEIDGEVRQVFLAARELTHENLQADQQGWVNQRLAFTHGFGITVTPVDEVLGSGRPNFFISNIPPEITLPGEGSLELNEITEPRIYFGEVTDPYVIVNSKTDEFDFPRGPNDEATTRYQGSGGIELGNLFKRLAFAWEFGDTNILVSGSVTSESRIVFRRNIQDRVTELAPFLDLDADPYIVVSSEGRLFWIQDAYTSTDRFPYSQPLTNGTTGIPAGSNYVRNSVKVVIDAFNGTVDLYIVDESDPIIRVWQNIFPDLFKPESEFPADLRAHWRYPEDLFTIQAEQYLTYHLTEARSVFNREGVWEVPTEVLRDQASVPVEPYYVTLRLPDEDDSEFLLIQPFTLRTRPNAISWLAGRSDGENYGKLFAFLFPTTRLVDGPAQIEARIDADLNVSAQFTLLGAQGSDLIRGNLLFLPIGDSYLYVEPIFLQAESSSFPLLQAVIVVNGETIALEETLEEAAQVALGLAAPTGLALTGTLSSGSAAPSTPITSRPSTETPETTPSTDPATDPDQPDDVVTDPSTRDLGKLISQAQAAFDEAQARFASSDFAAYGMQLELLENLLDQLEEVLNSQ